MNHQKKIRKVYNLIFEVPSDNIYQKYVFIIGDSYSENVQASPSWLNALNVAMMYKKSKNWGIFLDEAQKSNLKVKKSTK